MQKENTLIRRIFEKVLIAYQQAGANRSSLTVILSDQWSHSSSKKQDMVTWFFQFKKTD